MLHFIFSLFIHVLYVVALWWYIDNINCIMEEVKISMIMIKPVEESAVDSSSNEALLGGKNFDDLSSLSPESECLNPLLIIFG